MKERPIIFSGPMVRAILEGRKTQTRRIIKCRGQWSCDNADDPQWPYFENECGEWQKLGCLYGKPGDRLWVRESWRPVCSFDPSPETGAEYRADHHKGLEKRDGDQKWRPSIHMPRWASRITLEITGARVERLQEIGFLDARKEGMDESYIELDARCPDCPKGCNGIHRGELWHYRRTWESINGPESWAANPWVWVIEFRRVVQ